MNKILHIYTNDMRNVIKNWAAAILIGGLIFLPSLYAWLNINAMWDPYSRTGNLPVGIVNEDVGATVRDQRIDVGAALVTSLKENSSMQWHFASREKAMDKVEYGDYFATIIIPKDFSEKLASVINEKPEKANIEYYVNEKLNSVSPKITGKGASAIVEEVSSKFISTVNGTIFELFAEIGVELEKDLPDIERFSGYIFMLEEKLPSIHSVLDQSLTDANSAEDLINKAQRMVPEANDLTNQGMATIEKTALLLEEADAKLREMSPKITADLAEVQRISNEVNSFLSKIQETGLDFSEGEKIMNLFQSDLDGAIQTLASIQASLEQLRDLQQQHRVEENNDQGTAPQADRVEKEKLNEAIERTKQLQAALQEAKSNATKVNQFFAEKKTDIQTTLTDLQEIASNTSVQVDAFLKEYKDVIEPTVLQEVKNAQNTLAGASKVIKEVKGVLPEAERILTSTAGNLTKGKEALTYASGQYPYINEKVKQLAEKIRNIQGEADINEIIRLLQHDPNAERTFFEEPVLLKEHKLFSIKNYGTGMTPFYTVLAIWVGALLLISLLSVEVPNADSLTSRQVYFGRLLTFMTIGLLQTLIVTSGDMLLLGVTVKEPILFILFGLFISLVFMLIVYTLVSVFGNVGKAMAIVLLVLQIAGSGGTYPVLLLPEFYQAISPFLPFTYAVDLLREAVGGVVWERALHDIMILSIFACLALLLGVFLKDPINEKAKVLVKKSKESGLFH